MNNKNATYIGKLVLCGAAAAWLCHYTANAQPYVLSDGSTSAYYDPTSVGGMTAWNVGGQDHLVSQAFWVRTQFDSRERSLDEIYTSSSQLDANTVTADFALAGVGFGYEIVIQYDLFHVSANQAQIQESITLRNLSTTDSLDLSFFQYNNFDLGANGMGDYGRILTNTAGYYSIAQSVEPGVSSILEDGKVQVSPGSVFAEVAYYNALLSALEDSDPDDLSNLVGPIGPGNIEFAFQWNYSLAPGQDTTISKLKTLDVTLIPEPTTASLALAALGLLVARRLGRQR